MNVEGEDRATHSRWLLTEEAHSQHNKQLKDLKISHFEFIFKVQHIRWEEKK